MEIFDKYNIVAEYYKENPDFTQKVIDTIGKDVLDSAGTLFNIMNNRKQFGLYARRKFQKSYQLSDILQFANDSNVLIYFADLGLYGLVDDFNDLRTFTSNAIDIEEDTDRQIRLKHVILTNKKQKTVVLSTDNSDIVIGKIKKYINDCLKSDIDVVDTPEGVEVTIKEPIADSYDHCCEIYDKLYRYISARDSDTADKIKLLPKKYGYGFTVTEPTVDIIDKSMEIILQKLNCTNLAGANVQFNIAIGGGTVIGNNVINRENRKDKTRSWIDNNPPNNGESTTAYYNKYKSWSKSQKMKPLTIQKFTKDVEGKGYRKLHNKINYWVNE